MNAPFVAADHVCCYCLFGSWFRDPKQMLPVHFRLSGQCLGSGTHTDRVARLADPSHCGCWISIWVVSAALEPFSAAEVNCSADPPGRCVFFSPDASSVRDSSAWRVMDYPAEMCLHLWPSLLAERVAGPTMHWRSVGTAMSKGNTLPQYNGLWCSRRRPPPTDWERILIFVLFRISSTIALF